MNILYSISIVPEPILTRLQQRLIITITIIMPAPQFNHFIKTVTANLTHKRVGNFLYTGAKFTVGTAALLGGSLAFEIYMDRYFGPGGERPRLDSHSAMKGVSKEIAEMKGKGMKGKKMDEDEGKKAEVMAVEGGNQE